MASNPTNPLAAMLAASRGQFNPTTPVAPAFTPPPQSGNPFVAASQMAPQGGMPLPDPMARAQAMASQAEQTDNPEMFRSWFESLQAMPESRAAGIAAMGPPVPTTPPTLAQPMQLPQFPGLEPVDSIAGLIEQLQQRTRTGMGNQGGDSGGSSGKGGGGSSTTGGGTSGPAWNGGNPTTFTPHDRQQFFGR